MDRRRQRRAHTADEAAAVLRKAWCRLRLWVLAPARGRLWGAVMLTAASPEQAAFYDRQVARARYGRLGRFPASTAALAVPPPNATRIGPAPRRRLRRPAPHLPGLQGRDCLIPPWIKWFFCSSADGVPLAMVVCFMATKHVLLLHAGGSIKGIRS